MVPGWPDALDCSSGGGTKSIVYLITAGSLKIYGYNAGANDIGYQVTFNYDGTWHSITNTAGWGQVAGCTDKTISQLYAEGRAFNFIGNSGANGDAALGDRITSGTLAVTANSATGVVSLSTAGTTWGYLNSTRSYLPALSSVQVSSTNVSATLLQVGTGNGAACDPARRGSMRYSTVSSTMEYCNSSAWVSMGPSATAVPSFFVHRNGVAQNGIPSLVTSPIDWTHKAFDTHNNFDLATDRFTPSVPGTYLLNGQAFCNTTDWCAVILYKNGVVVMEDYNRAASTHSSNASVIVNANGLLP